MGMETPHPKPNALSQSILALSSNPQQIYQASLFVANATNLCKLIDDYERATGLYDEVEQDEHDCPHRAQHTLLVETNKQARIPQRFRQTAFNGLLSATNSLMNNGTSASNDTRKLLC